jgi:hypothetical protein
VAPLDDEDGYDMQENTVFKALAAALMGRGIGIVIIYSFKRAQSAPLGLFLCVHFNFFR